MNQLTEDLTLLVPEKVVLLAPTIGGRIITGLLIIEADLLITKRGSPVTVLTIFGVTEVMAQTVTITGVTTDQDHIVQDQIPGHIIGATIRGPTPTEAILLEDPVTVTVEAIPLPKVLHQDRLEANLDRVEANLVHLVQPEKGIKFWNNQ